MRGGYEVVELTKQKVFMQQAINRQMLESLNGVTAERPQDDIYGQLLVRLHTFVWSKKIADQTVRYPATWWGCGEAALVSRVGVRALAGARMRGDVRCVPRLPVNGDCWSRTTATDSPSGVHRMKFKSFAEVREWWHGREDRVPDKDQEPNVGHAVDPDDDLPSGPCVGGQEHDVVEVRAATARQPLYAYCRVCRVAIPVEEL